MKHCSKAFPKYENTIATSNDIVKGMYEENVCAQLLLAPTQIGKTSTVFWTLYNLMTHMNEDFFVPYPFAFIITGLNSNSWKEQTKERVLPSMRDNVWHNKDMCKPENIKRLKEAVLSDYNTMIVIDEVHVGTKLDHVIFNTLREFHPRHEDHEISQNELFEFLHSKRVKFLLVSATPDAIKETMENNWDEKRYRTIMVDPKAFETYTWHKHFLEAGRVFQSYDMKDRDENGALFHKAIAKRISQYDRPMYHMIRFPVDTKNSDIEKSKDLLKKSIQKYDIYADVVEWDAKNTIKHYFEYRDYDVFADSSLKKRKIASMNNEAILKQKPKRHVIFILKEFFRVAQTMPIDNIGVLVDRDTRKPCDSTLSQSLIGRACGHNKKEFISQIAIYTNVPSVQNYVKLWETGFDYAKVPQYKGNGLIAKNGKVKVKETMMGEKVVRSVKVVNDDTQDDTPDRLDKVFRAYMNKDSIVGRIIQMYIDHDFVNLSEKQLNTCSENGKINTRDVTVWDDVHGRYKILEKSGKSFVVRDIVKKHLKI